MRHRWGLGVLLLLGACSNHRGEEPLGHASSKIVTTMPAMIFGRAWAACATLPSGEVIYAGGDIPGGYYSAAESWDPVKHTWTEIAPLSNFRGDHVGVALGNSMLVSGGYGLPPDGNTATGMTEIFDGAKRTWSKAGDMIVPRARHTLTRLDDGRVLAAGGYEGYINTPSSTAEIYDPSKKVWTAMPAMAVRHAEHAAVKLGDGRVFVVGSQASSLAEVFAPTTSTWTTTSPMSVARFTPAAALLRDGRVIVAGGADGSGTALSTTEIWNPTTNAFTAGPPLNVTHGVTVALPLASGAILLGTGNGDGSVERLDSKATAWTVVGNMSESHDYGCVTAIPGGVLFAGTAPGSYKVDAYFGAAEGVTCKSDDECASGSCASSKCTAPPVIDAGTPDSSPSDGATDGASSEGGTAAADSGSGTPTIQVTFERCSKDSECSTGHCADGVCCDTACTDTCHSCALPSSAGKCTPEPIGVDLRGECGVALSCTATCSGDGKCVGASAGTQCAPSKCTSASTGVGFALCTERGARCPTAVTEFDCAPYACEPIFGACRTNCTTSNDCAGGNVCDVASKTCMVPPPGESSGGCNYGSPSRGAVPPSRALLPARSLAAPSFWGVWFLLALVSLRRSSRAL